MEDCWASITVQKQGFGFLLFFPFPFSFKTGCTLGKGPLPLLGPEDGAARGVADNMGTLACIRALRGNRPRWRENIAYAFRHREGVKGLSSWPAFGRPVERLYEMYIAE